MSYESLKDIYCENCKEKRLCRTYLGVKDLDEYDNTDPVKYPAKMEWDNGMPIIVTAKLNPLLGIEIDSNVILSTIPDYIMERISTWAKNDAKNSMRKIVDNIGVTKSFFT